MKIVIRVLAILAAGLVVAGIAAGIMQISGSASTGSNRPQNVTDMQPDTASAPAGFAARGVRPDGGREQGGSGFGDLGTNLFNVGWVLAVAAVTLRGAKLLENTLRRRQRLSVTPS